MQTEHLQNEHFPRWYLPRSQYNKNLTILALGTIFLCNAVFSILTFIQLDCCLVELKPLAFFTHMYYILCFSYS